MAKVKKSQKKSTHKGSQKKGGAHRPTREKRPTVQAGATRGIVPSSPVRGQPNASLQSTTQQIHRGPTIQVLSIDGETTIGDLLVTFPRTRDVLMKHGLRFDVEEAGYLYMTLSVFSAIHGHSTSSLVEQLVVASKEPPPQPTQQLRPIAAVPSN